MFFNNYEQTEDNRQYGNALICENGHLICTDIEKSPEQVTKFCKECGAATLKECSECGAFFHGQWYGPIIGHDGVSGYCYECGQPYPWTKNALNAMAEIIRDEDSINDNEQEKYITSLPALLSDTPQTKVATNRIKKFFEKAGKATAQSIREILVDVASEAVKKSLGL